MTLDLSRGSDPGRPGVAGGASARSRPGCGWSKEVESLALIPAGDRQVDGGEPGEDLWAVVVAHALFLDAGRGDAVGRRAVRLHREHHPRLELDGVLKGVQPRDDRALVQAEAEAVRELQSERRELAVEAEVRGARQRQRDRL